MLLMLTPTNQYQQVMRHDIAEIWLTWAYPLAFLPWDNVSRTNTLSQPLSFSGMPWGGGLTPFVLDPVNFSVLTSKEYQNSKWAKGLLSTTVTLESRDADNAWVCRNRLVVIHSPITCLHSVGIFFTHFLKHRVRVTCPTTIQVIIIIIIIVVVIIIIIIIISSSDVRLLTAHHWSWTCRQSLLLSTDTEGQYQLRLHMKHLILLTSLSVSVPCLSSFPLCHSTLCQNSLEQLLCCMCVFNARLWLEFSLGGCSYITSTLKFLMDVNLVVS